VKNLIENPILKGFNPDPSIIRVGEDFYIATSTFEWFPGVQIHHSKDLKNWELIPHPLNRLSQLDMKGNPDSCGVWAPCLSYDNGVFYLLYSNVRSFDGVWKDTPNYLVTTTDIYGEWSEPVYLGSRGFDGSLFHDTDGRKYYLTMLVDHRENKFFGGIEIQEYDPVTKKLKGENNYIHSGTSLGFSEGPHIFKRNKYYYLLLAEGGTEYGHAETVLRSKNILGPYEADPKGALITCANHKSYPLQKSGHGDFVEVENGRWFFVFLVGRPLTEHGRCILGRETAIEEIVWKSNNWPYLKSGSQLPRLQIEGLESSTKNEVQLKPIRENFDSEQIPIDFQSLRIPIDKNWLSLSERKGFLRLKGKESLSSTHNQALIARRVQHFNVEVTTIVEFEPDSFLEMAGLVFYYNTSHFHYLHITAGVKKGSKALKIITYNNYKATEVAEVNITSSESILLKGILNKDKLQFYFRISEETAFQNIGNTLDASILSDDYVREGDKRYRPAFTGMFVGLCCQDLNKNQKKADFDWFDYKEIN